MTVSEILDLARTLTWTNDSQVTDTKAVKFLNLVYHDLVASIETDVSQDYFWDIWTKDTVADQKEYLLESSWSSKTGMNKILRVEVKYESDDTYRTLMDASTISNYQYSEDYIDDNLHKKDWFFDIKENSILLYPTPTEWVTGGLRVSATLTLPDLTSAGTESDIFPWNSELRRYHEVLAIWMKQYIFALKWQTELQNNAIQEYRNRRAEILRYLSPRYNSPIEWTLPESNYYKY